MKQVKIAYEECKKKLPNRPPDEIDFGLGFRAACSFMLEELEKEEPFEEYKTRINEELQ